MHRPVSLSFRSQVAPLPDSSHTTRFASPGCPVPRALWSRGRPILGFPLVSAFRLCRRSTFELPRISDASALPVMKLRVSPAPHSCGPASDESSGCPSSSPPALPAMDRRVASILASFGGAGCESLELPRCFAPPVSPTISFQVSPDLHLPAPADSIPRVAPVHLPSGFAIVRSPNFSGSPSLARRRTNFLSFPKNLGPSASPINSSPGCPGFSPPGSTSMLSRVAPRPHRRLVDDVIPS